MDGGGVGSGALVVGKLFVVDFLVVFVSRRLRCDAAVHLFAFLLQSSQFSVSDAFRTHFGHV